MKRAIFFLATVLYGQNAVDSAKLLEQAREKIRATMKRIPKYACTQTIERSYFEPPHVHHGPTVCEPGSEKGLRLTATDRLRLDVAEGKEKEMHSWPGANPFDLTEIDQIVQKGPFGTGSFGGYVLDIFDNEAAKFEFRTQETREGHRVLVYAYSVAANASHYEIGTYNSWMTTPFSGTFELNPASLEIERLIVQTPVLPAETQLCRAESTLDLHRVRIGDGSFLLPRQSELHLTLRNGQQTSNSTTFSDCREFQAHSELQFGPPTAHDSETARAAAPRPQLPPRRYDIDLRIERSIDSEEAAAGDPVTATVVHDVHPYQSKEVVIPAGAVAHGRISRVEHRHVPMESVSIAIIFESIEIEGQTMPFAAKRNGPGQSVVLTSGSSTLPPQTRAPIGPPNSFYFPYEKRHVIPAGTVSEWSTVFPPITK